MSLRALLAYICAWASEPYFVREAHTGAAFCTLGWVWDDFADWYRDSWRMAVVVGTVPRSSPSAASAHRPHPQPSDIREVEEVASPPSG